jgi:hypothetical protein
MLSSTPTIEQRVEQLEKEITQLKLRLQSASPSLASENPWWEEIVGVFANDPDFEAAVELGRDYRYGSSGI